MKKLAFFLTLGLTLSASSVFAQHKTQEHDGVVSAKSRINWVNREFVTDLSFDCKSSNLTMPSGKKSASAKISGKMCQLTQPFLLSLYNDSKYTLSDMVVSGQLSLDQVYHFIKNGYKTPDVFSKDLTTLDSINTLNVNNLGKELVKHYFSYTPEKPIDIIASRKFSGIIIDARGAQPVHGEYIKSQVYPCFFPTIWDDQMNIVYEKGIVSPDTVKKNGLTGFHYSDNIEEYQDRVGIDPLYIRANEVFGRNRTDPIISRKDALKIFAEPENIKLLQEGKVVILLDKENLIYDIATPHKDEAYYVNYSRVKQYFYENKVQGIEVSDTGDGILFSVDLKFYPDSTKLLPGERERIKTISEQLKNILKDGGYTVLIEGHTADVGKPVGQLNLSIDRTSAVMAELIADGLPEKIFTYKGYGGTKPLASNETEEGRAQNRRVDITARPIATYIQRTW
ncbi:OmpA family protein [Treponema sp. C6A8]|uniref:OmpA family protein n=1 Tax=Treponema sp. C6A8 TaxID=1410609 RepID=UPI0006874851|nr:OmpA family protein [Treponema sp. C6A8]